MVEMNMISHIKRIEPWVEEGDWWRKCFHIYFISEVRFICLDVANGYSQFFVDYVKKVREAYPDHTIMVRCVTDF